MFIGATNMTLVYFCFNGNVKKLIKDEEFRWFFFFVLGVPLAAMMLASALPSRLLRT